MPSWDSGVDLNADKNQDQLIADIATIATNILSDITILSSYLILGFVIYGGYLYMFSSGDPVKASAGKKTLTHAFIGLAITISAFTIFGAIRVALIGNASLGECAMKECVSGGDITVNLITWVAGMGGVVAAIFLVVGGWGYMTASGDPNKLQKAKTTILYALIGLAIVALAEVLTAFISGVVRNANEGEGEPDNSNVPIVREIANINKED